MFRRAVADVGRIYRHQWLRIGLVQLLALLAISVAVAVVALVVQNNGQNLLAWVTAQPEGLEARVVSIATWSITIIGIAIIPVQVVALVATVRIADRELAGVRPVLRGSFTAALTRLLPVLAAVALAIVLVCVAVIGAPFLVFAGLVGLAITGVLTLVRRRRPNTLLAWPVLRTWALVAIPFAVLWRVAPTAILMPVAVVLENVGAIRAFRAAERLAAGRRWKTIGLALVALAIALGLSAGAALAGSLLWGEAGSGVLGGIVQLFALPLPIVAIVALYRRSAGTSARVFEVVAPAPRRASRTAAVSSPVMSRVATITVATLVFSAGIAGGAVNVPAASAAQSVTGTQVTYVVTSNADSTSASTISSQAASCLIGGSTCTVRGALKLAQQDAADGALGVTIGFASPMTVALAAPLTFAPDAVASTTPPPTAPIAPAPDAPADAPVDEPETDPSDAPATNEPAEGPAAEPSETPTDEPTDKPTDEPTEAPAEEAPHESTGATIDAEPASFVTGPVVAAATPTVVAAKKAAVSKIVAGLLTFSSGGQRVTLDGQSESQILNVTSAYWNLAVSGLTFANGYSSAFGGAISAGVARTTIDSSTFQSNNAPFGGGAIFARIIAVSASSFISNRATSYTASTLGGAIRATDRATVTNSTFGGNGIGDAFTPGMNQGSDIYGDLGMDVVNSSFVNSEGGSLAQQNGTSTVRNSIFTTGWSRGGLMCSGSFTGQRNISAQGDTTCPDTEGSRTNGALVGPLDNSGIVPVYPLTQVGNPAMGAGTSCPAVDTLGNSRPATGCDLGSVEFDGATSVALDAVPSQTVYGAVTFRARVSASSGAVPAGKVTFTVDGVDYGPIAVDNTGLAELEMSDLDGGATIDYTALFVADAPFDSSAIGPFRYTVEQVRVDVRIDCADPASAQCPNHEPRFSDAETLPLVVTVGDDRDGTVVLARDKEGDDVVAGPSAVVDGSVRFDVAGSDLGLGNHTLYAIYVSDDDQHVGITASGIPVVVLGTATVTLSRPNESAVYGDSSAGTMTVTVVGSGPVATGRVSIEGTTAQLGPDGSATIDLSALPVTRGVTNLVALYEGDSVYGRAASASQPFHTTTATTTTTITGVSPQDPSFSAPTSIRVTVKTGAPSTADPYGDVTVLVDGTSIQGPGVFDYPDGTADGTAHYDVVIPAGALSAGSHTIVASFDRMPFSTSEDFAASDSTMTIVTVAKATTSTTLEVAPPSAAYGEKLTLTATVDAISTAAVAGGSVEFSAGSTILGTAPLSACAAPNADGCSIATMQVAASTLGLGSAAIRATYSGAADFAASIDEVSSVVVSRANPTVSITGGGLLTYGDVRSYTISVGTALAAPADGGQVVVTAVPASGSPIALGTVRLVGGEATVTVPTAATLVPGSYVLTARFVGDTYFTAATGTQPLVISAATTDLGFDALSATSVQYGSTLQSTFTVRNTAGILAPEGDIVVSWNGHEVGRTTLTAAHNTATPGVRTVTMPATFTAGILAPDTGWLTAEFDAAPGFADDRLQDGAPEERRSVSVTPLESKISLDSTVVLGQPVEATAKVAIIGDDHGITPQGQVAFTIIKSGAGMVGPFNATLVNGTARLADAIPAPILVDLAGSWNVRATYILVDTNKLYVVTSPNQTAVQQTEVSATSAAVIVDAPASVGYGSPLEVSVRVTGPAPATGTVRLQFPGTGNSALSDEVTLVNGRATISATLSPLLALGDQQFVVYYSGNGTLTSTTSAPFTVTLGKTVTTTTVDTTSRSTELYPGIVGARVDYIARVTSATGTPNGVVRFSRGGSSLGQANVSGGVATLTTTPDAVWAGEITAEFQPASNLMQGSTGTLAHSWILPPVELRLFAPASAVIGVPSTYTVSALFDSRQLNFLPIALRPTSAPTGFVTVSDGAGTECEIQLRPAGDGSVGDYSVGTCDLVFASLDAHTVTARYTGSIGYLGSTATASFGTTTVRKGTPSLAISTTEPNWFGLSTVPVYWSVNGPSTGSVTVKLGSAVVCESTALTGSCDVPIPRFGTVGGGDAFTLSYSGDANWNSGSAVLAGAIVACIPFEASKASPAGSATLTVSPAPTCDNGTGYYTSDQVRVRAEAASGFRIYRMTNDIVPFVGDEIAFYQDGRSASVVTSPTLRVRGGVAAPFAITAFTEARCVPVTIRVRGISGRDVALNTILWQSQRECGDAITARSDTEVTASFLAGSQVKVTYLTSSFMPERYTFYGWQEQSGDAKFAQSSTYTVGAENSTITAAFGPLCYSGVPTLVQPEGGTLSTTLPAKNCAEPQSGKTGWTYGTQGAGQLVDSNTSERTFFDGWAGDTARFTVGADVSTYSANVRTITRPFTFPIVDTAFSIRPTYGKCVAVSTKIDAGTTNIDPKLGTGTITVETASNCPVRAGTDKATWYRAGTEVTVSTAPSAKQVALGKDGLKFLTWAGFDLGRYKYNDTTVKMTVNADTTVTAMYGTTPACRPITISAVPSDAITLKTSYWRGENPCARMISSSVYDQGPEGNGIIIDVSPAIPAAEGAEIVFAWATQAYSSEPGGVTELARAWQRTPSLNEPIYGSTEIIAYACEFVAIGANLYSPSGVLVPGGGSNVVAATQANLGKFVKTVTGPNCAVGADPRSGYGGYAWTVGTKLLPVAVADPVAYKFTGWSGDVSGTDDTPDAALELVGPGRTASGDNYHYRIAANYTAICYTLSSQSVRGQLAVVTAPNCPGVDASENKYLGGTNVVVHATDSDSQLFRNWASGTDVIDPEDSHWASVTMTSDKRVVGYYSEPSVGEQIVKYGTIVGDEMAVASKKMVGVIAAAAATYIQSFISKASLIASSIGYFAEGLEALGVKGAFIDGLKDVSAAMSAMLNMLSAPFDCIAQWGAGGKDTAFYAAQNLIGSAIVSGLSSGAKKPTPTADTTTTLDSLKAAAGTIKSGVSTGKSALETLSSAKDLYNAAASGNVGWESSAAEAWASSNSTSVFSTCMMGAAVEMTDSVMTVGS